MRRRPLPILNPTLTFIVGPTAIGKSRLAIELARRLDGEIISCDSMQVYKGMRILSQAPAAAEMKKIKHHLVGSFDPGKEYSVAIFAKEAKETIESIIKRKKTPVIVGGSGLYAKALIDGLFPSPKADTDFRKRMQAFISKYGSERLYRKLSGIDPEASRGIHPNDARRIIRALELYNSTGQTMTELKSRTIGLRGLYKMKIFGLIKAREDIYADINRRVDRMFRTGLVDEVRRLKNKRLSKTAKAALGLKEVLKHLKGEFDLEAAKELLKKNTRRFAKRQLTWFRRDKRIRWFDVSRLSYEDIITKIIES